MSTEDHAFIGERRDQDAGLLYLNARYYDPALGLFLQPDWFEVTAPGVGTNRYAYSLNDPVNLTDPGGNCANLCSGAIGALVGLAVQGAADLYHGELSSLQDYAAAGASGFVAGATFGLGSASFAGNVVRGAASGALATTTQVGIGQGRMPTGSELALGTTFGAVTGPLAGGRQAGLGDDIRAFLADQSGGVGRRLPSSITSILPLQKQLAAEEIAAGHAFEKHVIQGGEFAGLAVRTRSQYAELIENILRNPTSMRYYKDGRTVYLDSNSRTVVITNPRAEGTAFRPDFGFGWDEYLSRLPSRTIPW